MIKFKVRPDDGEPYEMRAMSRDVLVWERGGKGRSINALLTIHLADMYEIAYITAKRLGHYNGTKPDFEKTHDISQFLDFKDDDDELELAVEAPDPTQEEATADS